MTKEDTYDTVEDDWNCSYNPTVGSYSGGSSYSSSDSSYSSSSDSGF
ncbi:hypothetical protein [Halarcobacter sp.]|nr:hypothetical protein [Halarcobacter sp.]